MDLTAGVTRALEVSVLPTVIARGGSIRVVGVERGVATLEVTGSPGSAPPLISRIENLVLAAVPGITGVRVTGPGTGSTPTATDLPTRARHVVETEINPMIAAHGGHAEVDGGGDGWVRIRLGGGCQGCTLAEVTLRQGIEPLLRERLPDMVGLDDITDHGAGTQPWFAARKR